MADPAGNKLVPRFSPESVRAHHTALAFSLLFQAIRRNDVLTSLSVPRSEQRAGPGADRNTDKENPTHSFTNLAADPASTRRLRRCMVRVISLVKTGGGAITVSLGQIGRGAHLGTGMRRRPIYFPFFFSANRFTVYGPGVRADRERLLISPLLEDKKLVYYNRKVDRYYYGDQIKTKCHKIVKKQEPMN